MSPLERDAYTSKLIDTKRHGEVQYTLANLALSEARSMTMRAEEPSEEMLSSISYRIESAAIANEETDILLSKRALMLGAFVQPLIWSDLVNTDGLTNGQAKRVGERLGIKKANDSLAYIARQSLQELSQIVRGRRPNGLDKEEYRIYAELRGFLQEATVVLLGNRDNTAKMVVLPTLEFEDALHPDRKVRADGTLYDNRKVEVARRKYSYQAKSSATVDQTRYSVPVITGSTLGNNRGSGGWGSTNSYSTLRNLLHEREGGNMTPYVSSNLDRIWGSVRNKIMLLPQRPAVIPTPAQLARRTIA